MEKYSDEITNNVILTEVFSGQNNQKTQKFSKLAILATTGFVEKRKKSEE